MTLEFDPEERSICAIVFPKQSKSRIVFEAFLQELKRVGEKGLSRHRMREFALEMSRGKFVWHNARFVCSQRQVYKVLTNLLKLGLIRLEKRYGDKYDRYYVSFTDFSRNLQRIGRKWETEFLDSRSTESRGCDRPDMTREYLQNATVIAHK